MTPARTLRLLRGRAGLALALAGLTVSATACGSSAADTGNKDGGVTLNLVAYSTPQSAFAKLITAFQKTPAGRNVQFTESYGPSGQQARSIISGLPADVVNLSSEPDMAKLVKAGLVSSSWDTVGPDHGMVTDSVVVFVVRKGNPDHIHTWADLVRPGVTVVTPNPFSSGSARWNLMAAYGAELKLGRSPAQARTYLKQLLQHTTAQPPSASDALATFDAGAGDVLLDYEDDAIHAVRKGDPVEIVIPSQTILIENPVAVLRTTRQPAAARAFVSFLLSLQGQEIWAEEGYRPVIASAASRAGVHFTTPGQLFDIGFVGGWTSVTNTFFDTSDGVVTEIEQSLGVSTASG
jgi:sulfate/thiosulfate transport system substrate-binding protein